MTRSYRFISEHRAVFGVARLCRVLDVRRPGFCEWLAAADDRLAGEIAEVHAGHRGAYGRPRIVVTLRRRGRRVNHKRVARIMRERRITGITRRRRRSLTRPDQTAGGAGSHRPRLHRRRARSAAGRGHHLPAHAGGLAVSGHRDRPAQQGSRRPRDGRAHARRTRLRGDHTGRRRGLLAQDAIFHSDRGSQYTAAGFRATLADLGVPPSVGRTVSCYDNAVESFFATLTAEIGTIVWATRADVFCYLGYYNHDRLHSTLDHRTPHETRVSYRQGLPLAA